MRRWSQQQAKLQLQEESKGTIKFLSNESRSSSRQIVFLLKKTVMNGWQSIALALILNWKKHKQKIEKKIAILKNNINAFDWISK